MSTIVAILINLLMTGLGMQEVPEDSPKEQTEISAELPDKTVDETDQKC